MTIKIHSVAARDKLKLQREPYWHRIGTGRYVGFRKISFAGDGTWLARYRNDKGKQVYQTFGSLDEHAPNQRFEAAIKQADKWFSHIGNGGSSRSSNVRDICSAYANKVGVEKGADKAKDLRDRYRRWVDGDPIGQISLLKLTRRDVQAWRHRMITAPVLSSRKSGSARSKATVNRDMSALRAALNNAHACGDVASDLAWKRALEPFADASRSRELYLALEDRKRLIDACEVGELSSFLEGLSRLPLRPGALASLDVRHLEPARGVLTISKDKAGRDRKIQLPQSTAEFFRRHTVGKRPSDPLLSCPYHGRRWHKDNWKDGIKSAALKAGLPIETIATTLRHSTITDLVMDGLDLFSVAKLSGTSIAMIEKHYGHLQQARASEALAKLEL